MNPLKAVRPYQHEAFLNFKQSPFRAWSEAGGGVAKSHYPPRVLHGLAYRYELPSCRKILKHNEARLVFVEPVSITFDTFPYYATHEIVPMIWDCWPCYFDKMEQWLKRNEVRTAIFTSRQEMQEMQKRVPQLNALWCPEAVDTGLYTEGRPLNERSVDLLEFGRSNRLVVSDEWLTGINHVATKVDGKFLFSNEQLYSLMGDAKTTICLPRSMTQPEIAGRIETLTQRYWEAMLSRMIIIGHAPQELIDVCGYNPVIELDSLSEHGGLKGILVNIENYQSLVDKNHACALAKGSWNIRMKMVMEWLTEQGYNV